jgi:hypothetical protein
VVAAHMADPDHCYWNRIAHSTSSFVFLSLQ